MVRAGVGGVPGALPPTPVRRATEFDRSPAPHHLIRCDTPSALSPITRGRFTRAGRRAHIPSPPRGGGGGRGRPRGARESGFDTGTSEGTPITPIITGADEPAVLGAV
ncbi:hypothetical protein, partial [Nocardia brasiliensis]|uniref:hypothetical protein n=1 Tax=Nocardia brasiliensis TaxID=37326 RepID=UPI00245713E4